VLSAETTNTNFIVFGLTQPGLEPMIYHTQGEHANHYTTDAVFLVQTDKNICSFCDIFKVILNHYFVICSHERIIFVSPSAMLGGT
jgi:hypothetical protein